MWSKEGRHDGEGDQGQGREMCSGLFETLRSDTSRSLMQAKVKHSAGMISYKTCFKGFILSVEDALFYRCI